MQRFDGARALARGTAAALLAAALFLVGSLAACSSQRLTHHAPSASPPPTNTTSADRDWAADDACDNVEAQARLARYAETDFADAFNRLGPDYDAKREVFIAAESNAVQQVATTTNDDVPDPPLAAIRGWLDAARALISTLQNPQSSLVAVYQASGRTVDAYNAVADVCGPIMLKRDKGI
jgi:hypothetical protein